ncbi:prevent-host-death protein [Flavobacterium ardleyense]|uniref:prevent-host-death protein n=1 Tax=Flavobacterium ardleyense TaxID=2038737 RepID=UPI00298BFCA7|nr:prevent-host-death protein [Flavobacterium ardleyense]
MVVISSREFRQNQKLYFEMVDNGEQIIVQRGKNKSYALTPINLEDNYFNPAMLKRIQESLDQIKNGQSKQISTKEEITELLGL